MDFKHHGLSGLKIIQNNFCISLSKNKTADELNVLGNFIVGIGCLMLTIASQQQYISAQQEANNPTATDDTIIG